MYLAICSIVVHPNCPNFRRFFSDADAVEDMLDSLQEEKDIHDQIADVISRPGTEMFDDVSS